MMVLSPLVSLLFPSFCLACESATSDSHFFCSSCQAGVVDSQDCILCPRCGSDAGAFTVRESGCPRCRDDSFDFSKVHRLGAYEDQLRKWVLRAKEPSEYIFAYRLAAFWARHIQRLLDRRDWDGIVCVPCHRWSFFQRGFSLPRLMAEQLGREVNLPVDVRALKQSRWLRPQKELSASERRQRPLQSYILRQPGLWKGKRVLLVDDVLTTGRTLHICAHQLKNAGAQRVEVVILAKG